MLIGKKTILAILFALMATWSGVIVAQSESQSASLSDDERATFMFDFNMKRLMSHDLLKNFDLGQMMEMQGVPQPEDFDLTKIDRIFGGMQFPENMEDMNPQPGEDLKANFFMRFEFSDSGAADEMIESFASKTSKVIEAGSKKYYAPDGDDDPQNLRLHRVNSSTVEMGTERYVMHKDRNVISSGLAANWKKLPKNAALRLSIDVEGNRAAIDQMVEQAKTQAPPPVAPMLALVSDLASFSLGLDFETDTLLMLRASGKDSSSTENLFNGINGMLGMGKMAGKQGLSQAPMPENVKEVFGKIIDSLNAKTEGNTVMVDIKKPEGFDEAIASMMGQ